MQIKAPCVDLNELVDAMMIFNCDAPASQLYFSTTLFEMSAWCDSADSAEDDNF